MAQSKIALELLDRVRKVAQQESICKNEIDLLIKRIKIYEYMSTLFLTRVNEERVKGIIDNRNSVTKLGKYLKHLALKDQRRMNDQKDTVIDKSQFIIQRELYEQGLNGYGYDLMNLLSNPLRFDNKINHFQGGTLLNNINTNENPKIVFDLSQTCPPNEFYKENKRSRNPWDLNLAGYNPSDNDISHWKKFLPSIFCKHPEQQILPDLDRRLPHEVIPKDKKAVYISLKSRRFIDGPLDADYYVISLTHDYQKESIGMAAKANAIPYSLPIKRYVNWQGGPLYIPFLNLYKILKHVHENRGDWKTAFEKNISQRNLVPNFYENPRYQAAKSISMKNHEQFQEIIQLMKSVES
uniref:SAM-dependent MTase TRM10-type domain-containing protein n=1 Tax=Strongyloides stercoralis TaxID=6248 RepID=A0A0K0ER73_STRER